MTVYSNSTDLDLKVSAETVAHVMLVRIATKKKTCIHQERIDILSINVFFPTST